jgi:hypothetical protein
MERIARLDTPRVLTHRQRIEKRLFSCVSRILNC